MANTLLSCFKTCFDYGNFNRFQTDIHEDDPAVALDTNFMGHEVVVIKDGTRACGTGGVLGKAPLVQSKSYFEVKLQQTGIWSIGLATRNANLNDISSGGDSNSWLLRYDGRLMHDGKELNKIDKLPSEGDIIGVSYDHIDLNFYINGVSVEAPISGIRGTVYPVIFVDDGAILDVTFDNFANNPPGGFQKIMVEQSLL